MQLVLCTAFVMAAVHLFKHCLCQHTRSAQTAAQPIAQRKTKEIPHEIRTIASITTAKDIPTHHHEQLALLLELQLSPFKLHHHLDLVALQAEGGRRQAVNRQHRVLPCTQPHLGQPRTQRTAV